MTTELERTVRWKIEQKAAQSFLARRKREGLKTAFSELPSVLEHFGIAITRKGVRNPVWTLKGHGKVVQISADGVIEILK